MAIELLGDCDIPSQSIIHILRLVVSPIQIQVISFFTQVAHTQLTLAITRYQDVNQIHIRVAMLSVSVHGYVECSVEEQAFCEMEISSYLG